MTLHLTIAGYPATLTDQHSASSYGIPVLVLDGTAYGHHDRLPDGRTAQEAVAEASDAMTGRARGDARKWAGLPPLTRGRKRDETPAERVTWHVDSDVARAVRGEAEATRETIRQVLGRCVREALPGRFGETEEAVVKDR